MKLSHVVLGLAILLALATTSMAKEKKLTPEGLAGVEVVGADAIKKWLDEGSDMFLVDARKTSDFEAGHLPDAENLKVPLDLDISDASIQKAVAALEGYEELKDLPKDILIVTYCNGDT
jgi:rhodanese-related sulfurtransferase